MLHTHNVHICTSKYTPAHISHDTYSIYMHHFLNRPNASSSKKMIIWKLQFNSQKVYQWFIKWFSWELEGLICLKNLSVRMNLGAVTALHKPIYIHTACTLLNYFKMTLLLHSQKKKYYHIIYYYEYMCLPVWPV